MAIGPAKRKQLFENIVRLRRAERQVPQNSDLVAVRTDLESELGKTVSRSLAAQLLGVSHTALNNWIGQGDVPVVITPEGRSAVPVPVLVDLYEAVNREGQSGRRRQHSLEPVMIEARKRAGRLRPSTLVAKEAAAGHRKAELRSLAYHRAIARRLRRHMVDDARRLIWQWRDTGTIDPEYARRWEEILGKPIPEIRRILGEDTERGRDLRQTSPFAGLLSEPERRKILAHLN